MLVMADIQLEKGVIEVVNDDAEQWGYGEEGRNPWLPWYGLLTPEIIDLLIN
jgi:hypothetical protein